MHILYESFFFLIKKISAPQYELLVRINPCPTTPEVEWTTPVSLAVQVDIVPWLLQPYPSSKANMNSTYLSKGTPNESSGNSETIVSSETYFFFSSSQVSIMYARNPKNTCCKYLLAVMAEHRVDLTLAPLQWMFNYPIL